MSGEDSLLVLVRVSEDEGRVLFLSDGHVETDVGGLHEVPWAGVELYCSTRLLLFYTDQCYTIPTYTNHYLLTYLLTYLITYLISKQKQDLQVLKILTGVKTYEALILTGGKLMKLLNFISFHKLNKNYCIILLVNRTN